MKIFALIPRNFNLGKKLTSLMLIIFLAGITIGGVIYSHILFGNAENELNRQANALISTMDSVRKYNANKVTPLLKEKEQSEGRILLEAIPSWAMTEIFESLTKDYPDKYGGYILKNAMINPTNPKNKATNDEENVIEKLRRQYDTLGIKNKLIPEKNIAQGFLSIKGKNKFYTARPIIITDKNCLMCHTSLEKSPKSLKALYKQPKYSNFQGFGWELNKVIGTKIIYVPADKVYEMAKREFILVIGIFIAIFAVTILLATLWLKKYVVQPINRITQGAEAVSLGDMDVEFRKDSDDEIGRLVDAFTRMKTSLEISFQRLTKKREHDNDKSN